MRVVGVDQSYTAFGYCNGLGSALKKGFPLKKDDPAQRLMHIRDWYTELLYAERVHDKDVHVFMEGYAFGAKIGREVLGELGGVVKIATLEITGRPALVVPPTVLKKFVTGKGNAKKNEMLLHVYRKWGTTYSDDNEADAFALRQFGLAYLGKPGKRLAAYEKEAIEKFRSGK